MSAFKCGSVWAPKELSVLTATSFSFMSLIASVGNALIVFIVVRDPLKKLHNPFNYFVVNLAIADLIVGIANQPLGIYVHVKEYFRKVQDVPAKVFHVTFFISVTASILGIIALSVDRYFAVTFPLKYRKYMSWKRCWCISIVIWLISLTLPFIYFKVGFIDYLMVYANTCIIIASLIMIFTYIRIYLFLRKNTRTLKEQMRCSSTAGKDFLLKRSIMEKKVTRTFLVVLALFCLTYFPATVLIYILQYCSNCSCILRHWLRDFSFLLISVNSCMNPFIYTVRLKPFRQTVVYYYRRCLGRKNLGTDSCTVEINPSHSLDTGITKASS